MEFTDDLLDKLLIIANTLADENRTASEMEIAIGASLFSTVFPELVRQYRELRDGDTSQVSANVDV